MTNLYTFLFHWCSRFRSKRCDEHMRTVHIQKAREQIIVCDICDIRVSAPSYHMHLLTHNKE